MQAVTTTLRNPLIEKHSFYWLLNIAEGLFQKAGRRGNSRFNFRKRTNSKSSQSTSVVAEKAMHSLQPALAVGRTREDSSLGQTSPACNVELFLWTPAMRRIAAIPPFSDN